MPADTSHRGFPLLGQIGAAAVAGSIVCPWLRLPIIVACFAGLVVTAVTFENTVVADAARRTPERKRPSRRGNKVTIASEDSFPASDPPSWTPVSGTGTRH